MLVNITQTQPQAAMELYRSEITPFASWTFKLRQLQISYNVLLEATIQLKLLPSLSGQPTPNDPLREVFSLHTTRLVPGADQDRGKAVRTLKLKQQVEELLPKFPSQLQHCVALGQEKDSSWLTSLPIERHGFSLHMSDFKDAIALCYDLPLRHTPPTMYVATSSVWIMHYHVPQGATLQSCTMK